MEVAEKVGAGKKGLAEKSLGSVTGIRLWKPIYCSEVSDLTPYNNLIDHPYLTLFIYI